MPLGRVDGAPRRLVVSRGSPTTWRTARSRRVGRRAPRGRATTVVERREPSEPPTTSDHEAVGGQAERVAGRGPVAVAVDGEDRRAQRGPGDHRRGAAATPSKATALAAAKRAGQAAGRARHGVVARRRRSGCAGAVGGEHGGHAGVAADGDDDRRRDAAEQRDRPGGCAAHAGRRTAARLRRSTAALRCPGHVEEA